MALKPDRNQVAWNLDSYFVTEAERGGVAVISAKTSGVGMDGLNVVEYAANPSGKVVAGILLNDVVDLGTKTPDNQYKEANRIDEKSCLLTNGWVVTNRLYPGTSPAAGAIAYLGQSGYVTPTQASGAPVVGRFETSKDESGYIKVSINIP